MVWAKPLVWQAPTLQMVFEFRPENLSHRPAKEEDEIRVEFFPIATTNVLE